MALALPHHFAPKPGPPSAPCDVDVPPPPGFGSPDVRRARLLRGGGKEQCVLRGKIICN